jgi:SpoVK/Ycf46/Vps4 family AAA+-type ATPase
MLASEALSDLELLIRSRYGLIHIDTVEEERTELLLRHVSDRMTLPFFTWSRTRGLCRDGHANGVYETQDPAQALAHVVSSQMAGLYLFPAFDGLATNELIVHRLKEVAEELGRRRGALILTGTSLELHETVRRLIAVMQLPEPGPEEFRTLVGHIARDIGRTQAVDIALTEQEENRLLTALRGLSLLEAEKVLTKAMIEDHRLTADDIMHVIDAKKQIVEREGVLEYYPAEESLAEVADLAGLKDWLRKRRNILNDPARAAEFGLTFPKGLLLIGVPGCGKSLCARAVATEWGLPLLRLDTGSLYNKFIGETENNFRRAMHTAERLAPCVLFIDELEKAFAAGGSDDGGVSMRVLGTFLSWLQDRKADVFVVATANDVSRLPPEFLRKGRFDEVFFVDLPNAEARAHIARIHLSKRNQEPAAIDVEALVTATDGFSGAEIEQVIVAALYTAFNTGIPLGTELLLTETRATSPLSVVMAERVEALRSWAAGRTVSAN